jgi:GTPase
MNLPIITIFTKIDLILEEKINDLIQQFKSIVTKLKLNRVPLKMKTNDDIVLFSRNIQEKNIMPIFLISNIQWDGLNLLKSFLSMLPVNSLTDELRSIEEEKVEVNICSNYNIV